MLRAYITDNHRLWDQDLPQPVFALRSVAVSETTGFTLTYLLVTFVRELNATGKGFNLLKYREEVPEAIDMSSHIINLNYLVKLYKSVKSNLEKSRMKHENHYNLRRREISLKIGDCVLKQNFVQSNAANYFSSKLASRFVGPYRVKE